MHVHHLKAEYMHETKITTIRVSTVFIKFYDLEKCEPIKFAKRNISPESTDLCSFLLWFSFGSSLLQTYFKNSKLFAVLNACNLTSMNDARTKLFRRLLLSKFNNTM